MGFVQKFVKEFVFNLMAVSSLFLFFRIFPLATFSFSSVNVLCKLA